MESVRSFLDGENDSFGVSQASLDHDVRSREDFSRTYFNNVGNRLPKMLTLLNIDNDEPRRSGDIQSEIEDEIGDFVSASTIIGYIDENLEEEGLVSEGKGDYTSTCFGELMKPLALYQVSFMEENGFDYPPQVLGSTSQGEGDVRAPEASVEVLKEIYSENSNSYKELLDNTDLGRGSIESALTRFDDAGIIDKKNGGNGFEVEYIVKSETDSIKVTPAEFAEQNNIRTADAKEILSQGFELAKGFELTDRGKLFAEFLEDAEEYFDSVYGEREGSEVEDFVNKAGFNEWVDSVRSHWESYAMNSPSLNKNNSNYMKKLTYGVVEDLGSAKSGELVSAVNNELAADRASDTIKGYLSELESQGKIEGEMDGREKRYSVE